MTENLAKISVDRAEIRSQWYAMRSEYHELVKSIPPAALKRASVDTRWSIAEILTHMILSIDLIPREIQSIRKGKDFLNLPGAMVAPANFAMVKLRTGNATPENILTRYDRAFEAALQVWEGVAEDEWSKGAQLFGEGYRTIVDIYAVGITHFHEHASQIRRSLSQYG
jgi:hypothetical protein